MVSCVSSTCDEVCMVWSSQVLLPSANAVSKGCTLCTLQNGFLCFAGAPIGLLGMGIGGGCGVGIGLGYGFGYAVGAQYINVAPDFAERKQHKGNPNVIQQLQHQLDRLLHKDAGQT